MVDINFLANYNGSLTAINDVVNGASSQTFTDFKSYYDRTLSLQTLRKNIFSTKLTLVSEEESNNIENLYLEYKRNSDLHIRF